MIALNPFRFRLLVITSLFLFLAWITCGMIWRFPEQGNDVESTRHIVCAWLNVLVVGGLIFAHLGLLSLRKWGSLLLLLCVISFSVISFFEPPVTITTSALKETLNTLSDMATGALLAATYFTSILEGRQKSAALGG